MILIQGSYQIVGFGKIISGIEYLNFSTSMLGFMSVREYRVCKHGSFIV
jgi:hypothetical protein